MQQGAISGDGHGTNKCSCEHCGLEKHERSKCPARHTKCLKCRQPGHWSKVCRFKKTMKSIIHHEPEEGSAEGIEDRRKVAQGYFLGSLQSSKDQVHQWTVNVYVLELNVSVPFLIDTGADIICMPINILPKSKLKDIFPSSELISGLDGKTKKLKVFGKINVQLVYRDIVYSTLVYVLYGLKLSILGRPGIVNLEVLKFPSNKEHGVMNIEISKVKPKLEFPKVFQEIGEFKEEMEIKLKENVKPFVQAAPRIVPLPLLDKLKKKLERLIYLKIIVPVEKYTQWVSPIVVVPKTDNTVRICCDYTQINKSVLRAHFPILKVEFTLAMLKGSKCFSKLDTNSGFLSN